MNKKIDIYEKLKELFNLAKTVEKFEDAYLSDGSCLRGDFKLGGKLQLVSSDGNLTDVADGEYTLQDGRKVVVKEGVVDSISDVIKAADIATQEAALKDPSKKEGVAKTDEITKDGIKQTLATDAPVEQTAKENDIESMLPQIVADLADRVGALEAALASAKESNTEMSATIAKLSKEPAAEPIKRTTTADTFSSSTDKKNDFYSKLEELRSFRK